MPYINPEFSLPFDWGLRLSNAVDRLLLNYTKANLPVNERARKATMVKSVALALAVILANVKRLNTTPGMECLAIGSGSNNFNKGTDAYKQGLSYKAFIAALELLLHKEVIIKTHEGFFERSSGIGRAARYVAGKTYDAFISQFGDPPVERALPDPFVFKAAKGILKLKPTPQIRQLEALPKRYNTAIQSVPIGLAIGDDELANLNRGIVFGRYADIAKELAPVDCTKKYIYRVFNDDATLVLGGRFYGGFWLTIPRAFRSYLTINEQPTIELDYGSLHARLACYLSGQPLDLGTDPYLIPGLEGYREWVKAAWVRLLNASSDRTPRTPPNYPKNGITWEALVTDVRKTYAPICGDFFGNGRGLELQRIDSDMAAFVIGQLLDQGLICLPVHDSFVVQSQYELQLSTAMEEAVTAIIGDDCQLPIRSKR